MQFILYDIIFLIAFVIFVSAFLYLKKENLRKEGLLLLYKAKWGIKLINYTGDNYKKTLKFLSYISIITGYFLMIGVLWLFGRIFWMYVSRSALITQIKIPPIMPIIPYIDKIIPGFPPFYFLYFIVIIAIIAISHEFAHGIFMRRYGIKIKSTGFGFFPFFLPVFLAAFVEQDEKSFNKASKFKQMAVLSAGTFANLLTAILFFGIALLVFNSGFNASGVVFDDYAFANINLSEINMINGKEITNPSIEQISGLIGDGTNNTIIAKGYKFLGVRSVSQKKGIVQLYLDSPAIKHNIKGVIIEIDKEKINNIQDLSEILSKKSSGETINLVTKQQEEIMNYEIELERNPFSENQEDSWLGIYFLGTPAVIGDHRTILPLGERNIFYNQNSDSILFLHNLFEWLIIISLSVALVNMLPVGIFDGGRFFYLTLWGITGNKKFAEKSFSFVTKIFLIALLIMMISWVINLIL